MGIVLGTIGLIFLAGLLIWVSLKKPAQSTALKAQNLAPTGSKESPGEN